MVSVRSTHVFVIGGVLKGTEPYGSFSKYNIEHDLWELGAAELRFARHSASGCAIGDYIYVVGGSGHDHYLLNSIERLES